MFSLNDLVKNPELIKVAASKNKIATPMQGHFIAVNSNRPQNQKERLIKRIEDIPRERRSTLESVKIYVEDYHGVFYDVVDAFDKARPENISEEAAKLFDREYKLCFLKKKHKEICAIEIVQAFFAYHSLLSSTNTFVKLAIAQDNEKLNIWDTCVSDIIQKFYDRLAGTLTSQYSFDSLYPKLEAVIGGSQAKKCIFMLTTNINKVIFTFIKSLKDSNRGYEYFEQFPLFESTKDAIAYGESSMKEILTQNGLTTQNNKNDSNSNYSGNISVVRNVQIATELNKVLLLYLYYIRKEDLASVIERLEKTIISPCDVTSIFDRNVAVLTIALIRTQKFLRNILRISSEKEKPIQKVMTFMCEELKMCGNDSKFNTEKNSSLILSADKEEAGSEGSTSSLSATLSMSDTTASVYTEEMATKQFIDFSSKLLPTKIQSQMTKQIRCLNNFVYMLEAIIKTKCNFSNNMCISNMDREKVTATKSVKSLLSIVKASSVSEKDVLFEKQQSGYKAKLVKILNNEMKGGAFIPIAFVLCDILELTRQKSLSELDIHIEKKDNNGFKITPSFCYGDYLESLSGLMMDSFLFYDMIPPKFIHNSNASDNISMNIKDNFHKDIGNLDHIIQSIMKPTAQALNNETEITTIKKDSALTIRKVNGDKNGQLHIVKKKKKVIKTIKSNKSTDKNISAVAATTKTFKVNKKNSSN